MLAACLPPAPQYRPAHSHQSIRHLQPLHEPSDAVSRQLARAASFHASHIRAQRFRRRRERVNTLGLSVGARVRQRLTGFINRITKRTAVLVESPGGCRFYDARHYRSYYAPLGALEPADG